MKQVIWLPSGESLFPAELVKDSFQGAGEMAQQLRALIAFSEVLSSIPSDHMVAPNHL